MGIVSEAPLTVATDEPAEEFSYDSSPDEDGITPSMLAVWEGPDGIAKHIAKQRKFFPNLQDYDFGFTEAMYAIMVSPGTILAYVKAGGWITDHEDVNGKKCRDHADAKGPETLAAFEAALQIQEMKLVWACLVVTKLTTERARSTRLTQSPSTSRQPPIQRTDESDQKPNPPLPDPFNAILSWLPNPA